MRKILLPISLLALMLTLLVLSQPAQAQNDSSTALVLTIDGPLTPSLAEYLERGLLN